MSIRFVYFDLGNVLIRFSVHRMVCQISELVGLPEPEVSSLIFDERRYRGYELGEISTAEFLEQISSSFPSRPNEEELTNAMNNVFWANDPILPVARKLAKENVPRGILSNTNPLHWSYLETAFPRIWSYFPDHKLASFELKALKPFPEIYQLALDDAKKEIPDLQANEVLLIDDLKGNIDAALEFGFQGIHYGEFSDFLAEYKKTGLPVPTRYKDENMQAE